MNRTTPKDIASLLQLVRQQDWNDKAFSPQKAYICAEFSRLVYEDVQEYELKNASRIHLFASDSFRQRVETRTPHSVTALLSEGLDARFFVVRGRYAVTLAACLGDVILLAVRGTVFRRLWDWKANLDAAKYRIPAEEYFFRSYRVHIRQRGDFFHRGFFESIATQLPSISDELERRYPDASGLKLVWTGHSLGGAMAAIGHALYDSSLGRGSIAASLPGESTCAYTFGMPRYCGLATGLAFPSPHHIYKCSDLVPTVPPRRLGYVDSPREYAVDESGNLFLSERTDIFGLLGHFPRLLSSLRSHSIEGYVHALTKVAGVSRI